MASKKAAIQMSLGFIVAVVFAVVLLSLAITWIQGMIGDITGITEDLTQQASAKLKNTFAETNQNFAVWPNDYRITRGNGIKFLAGIKNNAPDSKKHEYVINIIPAGASPSICDTRNVETCESSVTGYDKVSDFMLSWTTVETTVTSAPPLGTPEKSLTIEVPTSAETGWYIFNVVACYDRTDTGGILDLNPADSFNCMTDSNNIWSSAVSVTIQVV
jgi:hypothetical protein